MQRSGNYNLITNLVAYGLVVAVIYWGWTRREIYGLNAEFGMGYALGLTGATCMLLLLLYPLRKRIKRMRRWGPTRYWFKAHMLLGIIGPVLILFHANFGFGSFNSTIALLCTMIVASSGLVGRYFYARIHRGLYGERLSLRELKQNLRVGGPRTESSD